MVEYLLKELPTYIPPSPSGEQVVNREVTQYLKNSQAMGQALITMETPGQHQEH